MNRFPEVARLEESTVQRVEELARGRRRRRSGVPPVRSRAVRVDVWRTALNLAGGDVRRLVVEGPESVLVVNRPATSPVAVAWSGTAA